MFTTNEKDLIARSLEYVKEDLTKNKEVFEVGSLERETLEKKYLQIVDLISRPKDCYTIEESYLVLRGLLHLRNSFSKSCELFFVGTIERETFDQKLVEIKRLIENFN